MWALFKRDLTLSARAGGSGLIAVLFFLSVITAVPFAVGPDLPLLGKIGPAILWIGALLSSLLGLDRVLQAERDDGGLDILRQSGDLVHISALMFIKALAHWVTTGVPLVIATPLFGLFLNMDPSSIAVTALTLFIGTPAIAFVGLTGAAAAVTLPRGGLLVAVLVLPFVIPVLIFGIAAAAAVSNPNAATLPPFAILAALTLFFGVIGPFAAALFLTALDE